MKFVAPPPSITRLLQRKPYLTWWVKDKNSLSLPAAVEAILNNADFPDAKKLFQEVGIKKVSRIFNTQARQRRCNYDPDVRNFFTLYFQKHAH
jgi:hypothetical protein